MIICDMHSIKKQCWLNRVKKEGKTDQPTNVATIPLSTLSAGFENAVALCGNGVKAIVGVLSLFAYSLNASSITLAETFLIHFNSGSGARSLHPTIPARAAVKFDCKTSVLPRRYAEPEPIIYIFDNGAGRVCVPGAAVYAGDACGLAPKGHAVWVAVEGADVLVDPFDAGDGVSPFEENLEERGEGGLHFSLIE